MKPSRSPGILRADPFGLLRVDIFVLTRVLARPVGPIIIMATYNNSDILMVPYEDLPNEDKDIISKAIEEFQNKCLLSIPRYVTIKLFRNIHYQEF